MIRRTIWTLAVASVLLLSYGVFADHGVALLAGAALGALTTSLAIGFTQAALATVIVVSVLRTGFLTGPELPSSMWLSLQVGGLLAFAVGAWVEGKPVVNRRVVVPLALWASFLAAVLLSAVLSPDTRYALRQMVELVGVSVLLLGVYVVRWRERQWAIADLRVVLGVLSLVTAMGVAGFLAGQWWATSGFGRMSGLTVNANYAGEMAAIAIPLALTLPFPGRTARGRMVLRASTFLVLSAGVVLSASRGAVIAAFIGGVVALWFIRGVTVRARWAAQAVLVGMVALAVAPTFGLDLTTVLPTSDSPPGMSSSDGSSSGRQASGFARSSVGDDILSGRGELYQELADRFAADPPTGSGFGTTPLYNGLGQQGHNLYLSLLAETGLLGFLTFAAFIAALVVASGFPRAPSLPFAAAVAVAVSQLTETSLFGFGSPTAVAAWAILLGASHRGLPRGAAVKALEQDAQRRVA